MVTADNILLLEDDAESLIRCQLMLESMGFTVDITTKIDEAKTHFNAYSANEADDGVVISRG